MTEQKSGSGIFPKLLLGMVFVALIPLGGLWYISSVKSKQDWTSHIFLNFSERGDALVTQVEDWVDMNLRVLRQNAALDDMISMEVARQNPVLKTIGDTYDWIYLAFSVAPDGQNIGRNDGRPTRYYGDRVYFRQVIDGKPIGQQVVIGRTSGKPSFILAAPIDGPEQQRVGVIAIATKLVQVSKAVTDVKIGNTGFVILLNSDNKAIAHGKSEQVAEVLQDFSEHPALQGEIGEPFVYEENGKQIVTYVEKTRHGWTLIVQQDYDDAFASLLEFQRNALLLLIVSLFVVVIVAYVLARRLATPVRNL